ncbi:MAG: glycosyltransferase [Alphaproteobacteria bacterium]|nr:glycosyltransferase [Alphaproteobacteria bacterium]
MSRTRNIVSLTSFPARINGVHLVIKSMFAQTVKPDMVVLYLVKSEFENSKGARVPPSLEKLVGRRFEIRWVEDNIRSYNKLYHALRDFPDDNIITIDDDKIYRPRIIERLLAVHKKYPRAVVAHRVRLVRLDKPYRKWHRLRGWLMPWVRAPRFSLLQTGVGSALYPPRCMHKDVSNKELFTRLAPLADDLWFWAMAVLAGTPIAPVPFGYLSNTDVDGSQSVGLKFINYAQNKNDEQMKNIISYYPELSMLLRGC